MGVDGADSSGAVVFPLEVRAFDGGTSRHNEVGIVAECVDGAVCAFVIDIDVSRRSGTYLQGQCRGTVGAKSSLLCTSVNASGVESSVVELEAFALAEFLASGEVIGRMDSQVEGVVHRVALTEILLHKLLVPSLVGLVGDSYIVGVGTAIDPCEGGVGVDNPVALRSGSGALAQSQQLEAKILVGIVDIRGEDNGHCTLVNPVVAVGLDVDVVVITST